MANHEDLRGEEARFARLMEELALEEGQALLEQNAALAAKEDAAVDEEVSRRNKEAIHKAFAQKQRWKTRRLFTGLAAAAVVLACLAAVSMTSLPGVSGQAVNAVAEAVKALFRLP